jgi:hypothetical protein
VSNFDEEFKVLLKAEKEESRTKIEVLTGQLKCTESAWKMEEMNNKELMEEISAIKRKLK